MEIFLDHLNLALKWFYKDQETHWISMAGIWATISTMMAGKSDRRTDWQARTDPAWFVYILIEARFSNYYKPQQEGLSWEMVDRFSFPLY